MLNHTLTYPSILLFFSLWSSSVLGVLKQESTVNYSDIVARLTTLRKFIPQKHYLWHIRWIHEGHQQYGTLEGLQQGAHHWIDIQFSPHKHLIFDKSNPLFALYPNKLCLCPQLSFDNPLEGLPGVCIHMIAMPFLTWNIVHYAKCAKLGRRAIYVLLAKENLRCEVFLDKNFNTILQAKMWDLQHHFNTSFTIKRLKKFKSSWGIQNVEFALNNHKTLLHVDAIEAKE